MSQRIVSSSFKYESQNCHLFSTWLKELSPFWKICSKELIFFFLKRWKTQRTEPFLNDSKNWTLFSFRCDSQNWTFFKKKINMTQRIEPFWNATQRIEPFFRMWLTELSLVFVIHRIEPFLWLKELNLFSKIRLRDWTLLFITTQRIEHFFIKKRGSQNWFFFWNMTQRIEFFLKRCFFSAS